MKVWRDIYSLAEWKGYLQQYEQGQLSSRSKTIGRKVRSLFQSQTTPILPHELRQLSWQLQCYHVMTKSKLEYLKIRIGDLRLIRDTADGYLRRFKIHSKPAKQTRNQVKQKVAGVDRETYSTFDGLVWSLARRADRKAGYLETLEQYYGGSEPLADPQAMIRYLRSPKPRHDNLQGMHAGVQMEKLDPLHRAFEFHLRSDGSVVADSIMGAVFADWLKLFESGQTDVPFFLWLEEHPVCTGSKDQAISTGGRSIQMQTSYYPQEVNSIDYYRADQGVGQDVSLLSVRDGLLMGTRVDRLAIEREAREEPYDTTSFGGKERGSAAFVWSRHGDFFAMPHIHERTRHSSILSGKAVRTAGMIAVSAGKITRINNSSGHYQPGWESLQRLVSELHVQGVFRPGAVVESHAATPIAGLKGERGPGGSQVYKVDQFAQHRPGMAAAHQIQGTQQSMY